MLIFEPNLDLEADLQLRCGPPPRGKGVGMQSATLARRAAPKRQGLPCKRTHVSRGNVCMVCLPGVVKRRKTEMGVGRFGPSRAVQRSSLLVPRVYRQRRPNFSRTSGKVRDVNVLQTPLVLIYKAGF